MHGRCGRLRFGQGFGLIRDRDQKACVLVFQIPCVIGCSRYIAIDKLLHMRRSLTGIMHLAGVGQ